MWVPTSVTVRTARLGPAFQPQGSLISWSLCACFLCEGDPIIQHLQRLALVLWSYLHSWGRGPMRAALRPSAKGDKAAPRPACCVYCEEGPERRQRFCYTTRPSQTRLSRSARVHAENVCCTVVTTALTQEPGHGLDILSHLSKQITTHTRHKTLQGH